MRLLPFAYPTQGPHCIRISPLQTYYGNDAYYTAGATYTVKNVFSKEVPVSWSDYVAIITHAFAEAGIVPSESVVIFTDHATNTMAWREKLAAEMFNNLKVQGMHVGLFRRASSRPELKWQLTRSRGTRRILHRQT